MNRLIINHIYALLLLLPAAWNLTSAQEYKLVWRDDFRGRTLDEDKWSRITRGSADWRNYMSLHEDLCEVKGGRLILKAVANDGLDPSDTAAFLTGGVHTKGKFAIGLGKVEIRARMESGTSVWPALWMLPRQGRWPDAGEIDIMEHLNNDRFVYQTIHTGYTHTLKNRANPLSYVRVEVDAERYNVFGVEIREDCIIFLLNGKETLRYPRLESGEHAGTVQFPFGSPYYILMDMQIGGAWVGPAVGKDLPVNMYIDWIKVYEKVE